MSSGHSPEKIFCEQICQLPAQFHEGAKIGINCSQLKAKVIITARPQPGAKIVHHFKAAASRINKMIKYASHGHFGHSLHQFLRLFNFAAGIENHHLSAEKMKLHVGLGPGNRFDLIQPLVDDFEQLLAQGFQIYKRIGVDNR
jgi:hypothetical protein